MLTAEAVFCLAILLGSLVVIVIGGAHLGHPVIIGHLPAGVEIATDLTFPAALLLGWWLARRAKRLIALMLDAHTAIETGPDTWTALAEALRGYNLTLVKVAKLDEAAYILSNYAGGNMTVLECAQQLNAACHRVTTARVGR